MLFRADCLKQTTVLIVQSEGLPNITGSSDAPMRGVGRPNIVNKGAVNIQEITVATISGGPDTQSAFGLAFDASLSNSIYGASNHVTPTNTSIKIWQRIN